MAGHNEAASNSEKKLKARALNNGVSLELDLTTHRSVTSVNLALEDFH